MRARGVPVREGVREVRVRRARDTEEWEAGGFGKGAGSGAGDDAAGVCAADPRGGRSGPARGEAGQGAACGQPRRGTDRRARHQRAGAGLPVCAVG